MQKLVIILRINFFEIKCLLYDLIMYFLFVIQRKAKSVEETSSIYLVCEQKRTIVKIPYVNSCLMFDLLAVIYECFSFTVFIVCVWSSVHIHLVLLNSMIFVFLSLPFNIQYRSLTNKICQYLPKKYFNILRWSMENNLIIKHIRLAK